MSEYTLDLFFVGTDVDDALESLPFLEQSHAEQYRADDASKDDLKIYEAEITFNLSTADITEVTA